MIQFKIFRITLGVSLLAMVFACSSEEQSEATATTPNNDSIIAVATVDAAVKNGVQGTVKPSAPISIRYEIQGTPIVGQPVAVNVFVSSNMHNRALTVHYRVNDATSMLFPESQVRLTEFDAGAENALRSQQITVIPQREGRLYLNVSAELLTVDGSDSRLMKTAAIPIQVGSAPPELESNGELKETDAGETVVSMPAEQT